VLSDISYEEIRNNFEAVVKGTYKRHVCQDCGNDYSHRQGLHRHRKKCMARMFRQMQLQLRQMGRDQTNVDARTINNHQHIGDNHIGDNVQNFNINLQPFGQEDMSHITHEQMGKVIEMRYEGIMEFARLLYMNKKNLNVFIPNVSRNTAMVYKPPNWESMREDCVTETLVQHGADMISDYMEANPDKVSRSNYHMMDKALTEIQKDRKENLKRRNDVKRVIEDNGYRKRVWDNFKDASGGELIVPPVNFD